MELGHVQDQRRPSSGLIPEDGCLSSMDLDDEVSTMAFAPFGVENQSMRGRSSVVTLWSLAGRKARAWTGRHSPHRTA